jgi:hypothetical protein
VIDARKLTFTDLLDGTFRTTARTWLTSLVVGGVLFAPAALLISRAYVRFGRAYAVIFDLALNATDDPTAVLGALAQSIGAYLVLLGAMFIQMLITLFVRACVTEHACRAAQNLPASLPEVFFSVLKKKYLKLIGQQLLLGLMYAGILIVGTLLASMAIAIAAGAGSRSVSVLAIAILFSLIFMGGCIAVYLWLAIRFAVVLEAVVVDNVGAIDSLGRSASLVKGSWWRVFGYSLLWSLMVGFAVTLVSTPIVLFSTLGPYMQMIKDIMSSSGDYSDMGSMFSSLFSSLSRGVGISTYVASLLTCFVSPVFMTILYLGLRAKKEPPAIPAPILPESPQDPK